MDVSTSRRSGRQPLELVAVVAVGAALAGCLLGGTTALVAGGVLAEIFAVTIVSQGSWAVTGRTDYRE